MHTAVMILQTRPTGEIANILLGGFAGGMIGGAFSRSIFSSNKLL